MASPPTAASQAWTEETQVKEEEERKPLTRIIEKATGQRVKDLTKPPKNSVPYTSTAARSKKVIKMQNRYARARPVPKGAKVPGVDDESAQVPFFLPSEKPAASFFATLDSNHRKSMSEYSRTLEGKNSDRKSNLRRQHAFIKVKSKRENVLNENEILERKTPKQKTSAHIGSNIIGDMLPVYDTFNDDFEDDLRNNNYDPSDLLTKRNVLLRKSQSMMALEKPSIKRSVSSGTFRESPVTPKLLERSGSGFNTLFSYNSANAQRRRRTFGRDPIQEVQSARDPEKFPVYDKKEIEQSLDEIDLLLPGVCISSPRRPSTVRPSTNMKPTRTPTYCSCCSLCDSPKSQIESPSPFELEHPDLFLQRRPRMSHHCTYCQTDDGKKLVQYAHGDVIKTFDWLSKNAKETPL